MIRIILGLALGAAVVAATPRIPWDSKFEFLGGILFAYALVAGAAVALVWWGAGLPVPFRSRQAQDAPPEPPEEPKDWRDRAILVLGLPLRLIGLGFVVVVIAGGVMLSRFPGLAKENDVELSDLCLRALDLEGAARPLEPLGYAPAVKGAMIDLTAPLTDEELLQVRAGVKEVRTVKVETSRGDGGYTHKASFSNGQSATITSTTPHLTVPREEIIRARYNVSRLFDRSDKAQWAAVLDWGEALFWTCWVPKMELDDVPKEQVPEPAGGTADERLWVVWKALAGDDPAAETELFELEKLFEESFLTPEARASALAWAKGFFDLAEAEFESFKHATGTPGEAASKIGQELRREQYRSFKRVTPPSTRWAQLWLLYRSVGLSDASRQAARARWLGYFPEANHARVVAMGERIAQQRRDAGEALPDVPDVVPALCVVQRLAGSDAYGGRCRQVLDANMDARWYAFTSAAIMVAYPNDEFYYLLASRDPLRLFPINIPGDLFWARAARVFGLVLLLALASFGVRTLLDWVIAKLLIHGRARSLWRKHRRGRGREPLWTKVVAVTVAAAAGALAAKYTLPEGIAVQLSGYDELFMGSFTVAAVGGILIATCRRFLAIVLTALRIDVEKTWLDEVLGVAAGVLILHYFGNDPVSLGMAVASDVLAALLERVARKREPVPLPVFAPPPARKPAPSLEDLLFSPTNFAT